MSGLTAGRPNPSREQGKNNFVSLVQLKVMFTARLYLRYLQLSVILLLTSGTGEVVLS